MRHGTMTFSGDVHIVTNQMSWFSLDLVMCTARSFVIFILFKKMFILRERDDVSVSRGGAERGGREPPGSALSALSATRGSISWP